MPRPSIPIKCGRRFQKLADNSPEIPRLIVGCISYEVVVVLVIVSAEEGLGVAAVVVLVVLYTTPLER
jgi:hypothetical protein